MSEAYDWAKDCKGSFDLCIDSLRERLERSKVVISDCTLYNEDCRFILPTLHGIDAVVTDPPYGIDVAKNGSVHGGAASPKWRGAKKVHYGEQQWDEKTIDPELIETARSKARWQIIFGGNYYALPASRGWLVWDKRTNGNLADCELIWTNLPTAVRKVSYLWNGFARAHGEPRGDHPTQKPIGVMRWCIQKLPPNVRTILDPFAGSGTTGVAAVLEGKAFVGIEREKRYFDVMCRRIEDAYRDPEAFAKYVPAKLSA
jgi:DNA modification methylase